MELAEKVLYHQIHPLKLLTDWGTAIAAGWLLWDHRFALGLLVGLLPPVVATLFIVRWADLEPYKASRFGHYLARTMTRRMELVRLTGLALAWGGAWGHRPWMIPVGVCVIIAGWTRGLLPA